MVAAVASTAPADDIDAYRSGHYRVAVGSGETFTHQIRDPKPSGDGPNVDANHWASFDVEAPVTVTVRSLQSPVRGEVRVRPTHDGVSAEIVNDSTVRLTIEHPGQYWVEIPGLEKEPLFLFANPPPTTPPVTDRTIPLLPGDDYRSAVADLRRIPVQQSVTLKFAPGVHCVGRQDADALRDNVVIDVADGAVVVGSFMCGGLSNVTFRGRGVIDGGHPRTPWRDHAGQFEKPGNIDDPGSSHENVIQVRGGGEHCRFEDITIASCRGFMIDCFATDSVVDNVKGFGWFANTDAVGLFRGATVRNSFFKPNDDCVKMGSGRLQNCVIWSQSNAHVFVSRIFGRGGIGDVLIRDVDIIRREINGRPEGVFSMRGNPGGGVYGNVRFEDIRIETDVERLFDLEPTRESPPFDDDKSSKDPGGELSRMVGWRFRNIDFRGRAAAPSRWSAGYRGQFVNTLLDQVTVNGTPVTGFRDLSGANGVGGFEAIGRIERTRFQYGDSVTVADSSDFPLVLVTRHGAVPYGGVDVHRPATVVPRTWFRATDGRRVAPEDWTVVTGRQPGDVGAMVDGDLSTRWTTRQTRRPGQTIEVDFGTPLGVSTVRLNPGENSNDASDEVRVEVDGGEGWRATKTRPVGGVPEALRIAAPEPVRRLRFTQRGTSEDHWWSVAELEVYR